MSQRLLVLAISISWMILSLALAFGTWMTGLMVMLTWGIYFMVKISRMPVEYFYPEYSS